MTVNLQAGHAPRVRDTASIPKGWKTVRLANVADARLGKMLDAQKNRGRLHPYLRNPNIRWFDVDLTDLKEMRFEEDEEEKFSIRDGDVLICEGGEAGRAAIWRGPDVGIKFQKAIHRVRPRSELFNRFLVHRLFYDYHSGRLNEYYTGATIGHFTGQDLARYEFPLPPLDEQRRIAVILDQADDLRRKRMKASATLKEFATALFVDAFERRNASFPSIPLEELVSDTKIGLVRSSEAFGKDFPYFYVRMDAITREGEFDHHKVLRTTASDKELRDYMLVKGDFLFNTRNSRELVGKTTLFPGGNRAVFNNNVMRIHFRDDVVPEYVAAAFQRPAIQAELESRKSGTTSVYAIYWRELKTLPLSVPPIDLQRAFAARVAEIDALKAHHRAHLAKLDALFASLQHRAFRGEL